jgi:hypothetical protein
LEEFMFLFVDGTAVSALSLFAALVLGYYATAHEDWWIFRNEAAATTLAIVLSTSLVVGCITAWVACYEYGLPMLIWMAGYLAAIAVAVIVARFVAPLVRGVRNQPAT